MNGKRTRFTANFTYLGIEILLRLYILLSLPRRLNSGVQILPTNNRSNYDTDIILTIDSLEPGSNLTYFIFSLSPREVGMCLKSPRYLIASFTSVQ